MFNISVFRRKDDINFPFTFDSPFINIFNEVLLKLKSSGGLMKLKKKFEVFKDDKCVDLKVFVVLSSIFALLLSNRCVTTVTV